MACVRIHVSHGCRKMILTEGAWGGGCRMNVKCSLSWQKNPWLHQLTILPGKWPHIARGLAIELASLPSV